MPMIWPSSPMTFLSTSEECQTTTSFSSMLTSMESEASAVVGAMLGAIVGAPVLGDGGAEAGSVEGATVGPLASQASAQCTSIHSGLLLHAPSETHPKQPSSCSLLSVAVS
jgi:hypothetical protein